LFPFVWQLRLGYPLNRRLLAGSCIVVEQQ
jgi:hypothetical protein